MNKGLKKKKQTLYLEGEVSKQSKPNYRGRQTSALQPKGILRDYIEIAYTKLLELDTITEINKTDVLCITASKLDSSLEDVT